MSTCARLLEPACLRPLAPYKKTTGKKDIASICDLHYNKLMNAEILSPTDDWIFKLLFGDERNKSILIDLLGTFVQLPQ